MRKFIKFIETNEKQHNIIKCMECNQSSAEKGTCSYKYIKKESHLWLYMPLNPATWEAEVGGSQSEVS
jgi:hypothetical protein